MNPNETLQFYALASAKNVDFILKQHPRLHYAMVHHVNVRGEGMRFHDKPYLIDIYTDTAPEIILQSSVQTGKSEFLIVSAHSWAEQGLQVMYVLPTIDLRNTFVANRVDKLYEQVPHYQKMIQTSIGSSDSRGLKHFGPKGGSIFFSGSNSRTTFIEKPIDLIIGDETDRFDQANYEKAEDRMTASPYKLWYEASNPTVENYAINARYRISDQRQWFVKCACCNYWQTLDFFKNVVQKGDDGEYRLLDESWEENCGRDICTLCIRCGKPLDRFTHKAQWVAKFPTRKNRHGYHIHQMLSSFVTVEKMWEKFRLATSDDTKMQVFYNSVLGLPYAGVGSKITDKILEDCKEDYTMPAKAENCFMGVDVGKRMNVIIFQLLPNERFRIVFIGTVKTFEELDILFARFEIISYVLDGMPETRLATEYAKKRTGRGWICRYHNSLEEVRSNDDTRVISVDRTMIMDRVMAYYANKKFIVPKNAQSIDGGDFYTQMKTPTRVYDKERETYDWVGDPDHYYHATNYALLAYIVRGDFRVTSIGIGPTAIKQAQMQDAKDIDLSKIIPPGTDPQLVEHYKNLYLKSIADGTINRE